MLFAMAEIVLQVVALGFQDVKRLVLDLLPGPATGGEFGDIRPADIQVRDEAVPVCDILAVVADFNHQRVDGHRLLITA
jgi:hypothetical protein